MPSPGYERRHGNGDGHQEHQGVERLHWAASAMDATRESRHEVRSTFATRISSSKEWAHLASDRKSTRLNSSHLVISYAVFCLKKKPSEVNALHLVHAVRWRRTREQREPLRFPIKNPRTVSRHVTASTATTHAHKEAVQRHLPP